MKYIKNPITVVVSVFALCVFLTGFIVQYLFGVQYAFLGWVIHTVVFLVVCVIGFFALLRWAFRQEEYYYEDYQYPM